MRPVSPTARKAGAALAALMLSTALTACQPDSSTASAATPTSVPTPTDQASAPASNSTGGSQSDTPKGLESFYSQTIDWKDCSTPSTAPSSSTPEAPAAAASRQ